MGERVTRDDVELVYERLYHVSVEDPIPDEQRAAIDLCLRLLDEREALEVKFARAVGAVERSPRFFWTSAARYRRLQPVKGAPVQENYMAQPTDYRHPNNPNVPTHIPGRLYHNTYCRDLDVEVEYTRDGEDAEIVAVWAGDPALDLMPLLGKEDLKSIHCDIPDSDE